MDSGGEEVCLGAADDGIDDAVEDGKGTRDAKEEAVVATLFDFERLSKVFEAIGDSSCRDEDAIYADAEVCIENQKATINQQGDNDDNNKNPLDDIPDGSPAAKDIKEPFEGKGIGDQDAKGDKNRKKDGAEN